MNRIRPEIRNAVARALALAVLASGAAQAGPLGAEVVAGRATIDSTQGSTTIHQASQSAVLNWQSFDIDAGESVRFVQPSSQAVALNRVLSADPSCILGRLSANGTVFLVNPNGVVFGAEARVSVG